MQNLVVAALLSAACTWLYLTGSDLLAITFGVLALGNVVLYMTGAMTASKSPPTSEQIAELAEKRWRAEGCPEGRDVEFWLRAEGELRDSR